MRELKKKFKVGDTITYLPRKQFFNEEYYWQGDCQGGSCGTIVEYNRFHSDHKCWEMFVTTRSGRNYRMLEKEFKEYNKTTETKETKPKKSKSIDNYSIW